MLEMTKAINQQNFPDHKPKPGESGAGLGHLLHLPPGRTHPENHLPGKGNLLDFYASRNQSDMKRALVIVVLCVASFSWAQAPAAAQATAGTPKKLLFLTHAALYKHTSLGPAEKAVIELGKAGGFDVTTVEGYKQDSERSTLIMTPEYLPVSWPDVDDERQPAVHRRAEKEPGRLRPRRKGAVGAHCATVTFYNYPTSEKCSAGIPTATCARHDCGAEGRGPEHPATTMLGGVGRW